MSLIQIRKALILIKKILEKTDFKTDFKRKTIVIIVSKNDVRVED